MSSLLNPPLRTDPAPARHVFVYGTLRRGEVNDINALQPAPTYVGGAMLNGTLYPMGWYPGLVMGGESLVVGEVYSVSPELEERLDEIEGLLPEPSGEYAKREVEVDVDASRVQCFVYEIATALVAHLEPLESGDWRDRPGS